MRNRFGRKAIILLVCMVMPVAVAGCAAKTSQATTYNNRQPLEVVAVTGPMQPINPGGPVVEITLKNIAAEPVTAVTANLELSRSFTFTFDISNAKPLLSNKTVSAGMTLIGGSFDSNVSYPLTISGTTQLGDTFSYTVQVKIVAPVQ